VLFLQISATREKKACNNCEHKYNLQFIYLYPANLHIKATPKEAKIWVYYQQEAKNVMAAHTLKDF